MPESYVTSTNIEISGLENVSLSSKYDFVIKKTIITRYKNINFALRGKISVGREFIFYF